MLKAARAELAWLAGASAGLAVGAALRWIAARPEEAQWVLALTLVITGAPLVYGTLRQVLRGRFEADVVAALALVVSFVQGQHAAGVVIVLMLTTGRALEAYGRRRASDALAALLGRAPRVAHRYASSGGAPQDALIDVPVDAEVLAGKSSVDESALTGEPMPVPRTVGGELRSGTINVDGALEVRALRPAAESEYAQVVRLMEQAQRARPEIQRVADRVAVWFTPLTLLVAAAAYVFSGDASRVLAVLVVATPCPLILATPVALIAGINRAARHGIVVKNGAAIESLSRIRTALFDKTGTLTYGRPAVRQVTPLLKELDGDELLRLVAAVERNSPHLLARAIAAEAARRRLVIPDVDDFSEVIGRGAHGRVEGSDLVVGAYSYVCAAGDGAQGGQGVQCRRLVDEATERAELVSVVAIDGVCAGVIAYADEVRPALRELTQRLRGLGVRRVAMLTGDGWRTARAVAALAGIEDVRAELRPADKTAAVAELQRAEPGVLMVGDGINDAPALASAAVGVAMGARGAAISAAAADVVLLVDDVQRVGDAIAIGQRTMRVVRECILIGLGLSFVAMGAAAFGLIHPVVGAGIQEAIDLFVVLNALRARVDPR